MDFVSGFIGVTALAVMLGLLLVLALVGWTETLKALDDALDLCGEYEDDDEYDETPDPGTDVAEATL